MRVCHRVVAPLFMTLAVCVLASRPKAQAGGEPSGPLRSLDTMTDLRSAFEHDRDKIRIVFLLSPT